MLGVGPEASADDIHAAYRRLSRSTHPDAGGSEAQFRRVRRAYDALTDAMAAGGPLTDPGAQADAPATVARQRAPSSSPPPSSFAPSRTSSSSASSATGCVVAAVLAVAAVVGIVVLIAVLASSSTPTAGPSPAGTAAPPATGAVAEARWRSTNEALVAALVANAGDVGAALATSTGSIAVQPLHDACARRQQLLDELAAASPTPREDLTLAITRFVASERQAMAACLATPPDLDGLAAAGERGQRDLRTIVAAAQPT